MRPVKKEPEGVYLDVKLSEVIRGKLLAYLMKMNPKIESAEIEKKDVPALLDVYSETVRRLEKKKVKFVGCDRCGAASDEDLDECPVCGDLDEKDSNSLDVSKSAGEVPQSSEIATAESYVIGTREGDLDAALAVILKAKSDLAANMWQLGIEALRIKESKLYLERRDETNKPRHRTWEQFCSAEIGLSARHVDNMIMLSKTCDAADFAKVGATKMQVIAKLQPADREVLLEAARNNASLREIVDRARIFKTGTSKPGRARLPTIVPAKTDVGPEKTPSANKGITVIFQQGKTQIKLEKNGKGHLTAKEELLNAVVTYYDFDPKTNVLEIRRVREED